MAVTVPLDTARTRLLLDKDKHPQNQKGAFALIRQLIREEGMSVDKLKLSINICTYIGSLMSCLCFVNDSNTVYMFLQS